MDEQAFRFGQSAHLVGITGVAAEQPTYPGAPCGVILLNAGLLHRVGPFRLHVELARRLNALGYPTLRFDLSTLGDSASSAAAQSRIEQVRADVGDAMKLLSEQSGCQRFVLVGLCSGAQNAHIVATTDARVAGAVFLDGYAYPTLGFRLRRYLPRLLDPVRVWRYLQRRRATNAQDDAAVFEVAQPPRAVVRAELLDMLARGLKLQFIFSGGASDYFNHTRQFRECYGRAAARHAGLSVHLLDEADHTYILTEDRGRLMGIIESWLQQQFPMPTADSPT